MKYISNTLEFKIEENTVITLGKFDGLHRGHELLVETLQEVKCEHGYQTVIFTFDIPPKPNMDPKDAKVITTNEEKRIIFEEAHIDYLVECPFTKEVMSMEPAEFVRWIVKSLSVKCIVVGKDFHFGYQRRGDYHLLQSLEDELGYKTIVHEKIQEDEKDISSTFVREEISKGNFEKANHLLGYEFFAKSMVIHGNEIGRTLGFPTINMQLAPEKILPPNGVYVTRVCVGEKWYQGVSNVGVKPTIKGEYPVGVETYILDFCQDVYGQVVTVCFLHKLRDEMKFSSIEDLKNQMQKDIIQTQKYYKNIT